jgi:hypothetical protein
MKTDPHPFVRFPLPSPTLNSGDALLISASELSMLSPDSITYFGVRCCPQIPNLPL